jgi:hypothetical protein
VKLIALVSAASSAKRVRFGRWLLASAVPDILRWLPPHSRCAVNIADQPSPWGEPKARDPLYDAVIEVWTPDDVEPPEGLFAAVSENAGVCHVYRAQELRLKESNGGGVNLVAVWDALPGLSREEAQRHWREHIPLAMDIHHGMTRYTHTWLEAPLSPDAPPHSGIAALQFPSPESVGTGLYRRPEDVKTIADHSAEFMAAHYVLCTREHVVGTP